jgi:catechol 2,3-dioxygenase
MNVSRRQDVLGVHSLDHFEFSVPDLNIAEQFYNQFGLDVRRSDRKIQLYTFGHSHRWVNVKHGPRKALSYLSFGAFNDDMERFRAKLVLNGVQLLQLDHAISDNELWFRDPHGVLLNVKAAEKSSPNERTLPQAEHRGIRGAPLRENVRVIHPGRMSHALFFTPDIKKSVQFYCDNLGLRISDFPGPVAFLHGVHGSDHHLIAFAQSNAAGFHHSSWDVNSVEEVGLGAEQMVSGGFTRGWGLGRHVLGSNYFYYVEDPWGSFSEYSFDIDYIPVGTDWTPGYPSPANSLYLWGPPPPDNFTSNSESS